MDRFVRLVKELRIEALGSKIIPEEELPVGIEALIQQL